MLAWIVSLGTWTWFILAALLFVLEVLAPGMFMLWLGLSAIILGVVTSAIVLSWQVQIIGFAVLALVLVPAWRHFATKVERRQRARSSTGARRAMSGAFSRSTSR
jgi:inner membrane protein